MIAMVQLYMHCNLIKRNGFNFRVIHRRHLLMHSKLEKERLFVILKPFDFGLLMFSVEFSMNRHSFDNVCFLWMRVILVTRIQ